MGKRNKQGELVDENGLRVGDKIPGSKFLRTFCICCSQPIRVATERLLDSECDECKGSFSKIYHPATGEPFVRGLGHLRDYDDSDLDGERH